MGKFVDQKLEQLGAERVFELGLGDDDAKYEQLATLLFCSSTSAASKTIAVLQIPLSLLC